MFCFVILVGLQASAYMSFIPEPWISFLAGFHSQEGLMLLGGSCCLGWPVHVGFAPYPRALCRHGLTALGVDAAMGQAWRPPHLVGNCFLFLDSWRILVFSSLTQLCFCVAWFLPGPSVSSLKDYFRLHSAQTEALLRTIDSAALGHWPEHLERLLLQLSAFGRPTSQNLSGSSVIFFFS